jgi:hypothetical protein
MGALCTGFTLVKLEVYLCHPQVICLSIGSNDKSTQILKLYIKSGDEGVRTN